jgi:Silicon transporter
MLNYINNFFVAALFWVFMGMEFTGLLHASYILQIIVCYLAGKPVESKEPPRSGLMSIFFWARCLFSVSAVIFSIAVTFRRCSKERQLYGKASLRLLPWLSSSSVMSACLKPVPSLRFPRFGPSTAVPTFLRRKLLTSCSAALPRLVRLHGWKTALCCVLHVLCDPSYKC